MDSVMNLAHFLAVDSEIVYKFGKFCLQLSAVFVKILAKIWA